MLRPLKNAPFRSLRLSAQSLRCVRILILKIFNIFLRLKSSRALILNEIERFSKVSCYLPKPISPMSQVSYSVLPRNFSTVTLAAHRINILVYLAPARYIPKIKTRCDNPYVKGPPIITIRGLFR